MSTKIRNAGTVRMARTTAVTMVALALVFCSRESANIAGSGSRGGNPVVCGMLVGAENSPASNTVVRLVPENYDPVKDVNAKKILTDTTDHKGEYRIETVDTGLYNVDAIDIASNTRALIRNVHVGKSDTTRVADDSMRAAAIIKVPVYSGFDTVSGYIYSPGTMVYGSSNTQGDTVVLLSVPGGVLLGLSYATKGSLGTPMDITDSIVVLPGQSIVYPYVGFTFKRKLFLNTTSSGAAVAGLVVHFPVLVRLTSSNFDFSQATSNGRDVRFARSDGTAIPYDIEQWDSAGHFASIWVKVDTIYADDSTHYFCMYWGASTSTVVSGASSSAVFDTSDGFEGVWHMGQQLNDATPNHFDGAVNDSMPPASNGQIGTCRQFDGKTNYVQMPGTASGKLNFPAQGTYALSAWVYADTLDSAYSRIVEKNDFQYKIQIDYKNNWHFAEYEDTKEFDITNYPASAGAWVYLVGVRAGGAQYLYVNGICVTNTFTALTNSVDRDTTSNITLGRSALGSTSSPCFFTGKIDEVRIQNRALSADWVKLCYTNQNSQDRLVVFK